MAAEYILEDLRSKQAMPEIRMNSRLWAFRNRGKDLFDS